MSLVRIIELAIAATQLVEIKAVKLRQHMFRTGVAVVLVWAGVFIMLGALALLGFVLFRILAAQMGTEAAAGIVGATAFVTALILFAVASRFRK